MVLAMNAGMDSAIVDPTNKNMIGMIYATNALLERDEYCLQYIDKFGNKASEEAAQPAPASPLDEKMQKVFKLTQDAFRHFVAQRAAADAGKTQGQFGRRGNDRRRAGIDSISRRK